MTFGEFLNSLGLKLHPYQEAVLSSLVNKKVVIVYGGRRHGMCLTNIHKCSTPQSAIELFDFATSHGFKLNLLTGFFYA